MCDEEDRNINTTAPENQPQMPFDCEISSQSMLNVTQCHDNTLYYGQWLAELSHWQLCYDWVICVLLSVEKLWEIWGQTNTWQLFNEWGSMGSVLCVCVTDKNMTTYCNE